MNGAGKSRLLRGIAQSIPSSTLLELNGLISYMRTEIGKRDDIEGLLEENSPLQLKSATELAIRDLVRRDYEKVGWYAVPIADSPFADLVDDEVVPIFQVDYAGSQYDFRGMGSGELSAHLLLWLLTYGRGATQSMLLMDEPEAFLPTPSRQTILNYVLDASSRGGYAVVLASHSLELIQPALAAGAGVLVTEDRNLVSFVGAADELVGRVAGMYGSKPTTERILICEDESAFVVAKEYIKRQFPDQLRSTSFLWCNGYSDLEAVWKHLPKPGKLPVGMPEMMFIADGDKEPDVAALLSLPQHQERPRWPFIALPDDPDNIFKKYASLCTQQLTYGLGIPYHELLGLLDAIRGRNPHDWRDDVLKASSIPERQAGLAVLAAATVPHSLEDGTATEFISQVRQSMIGTTEPNSSSEEDQSELLDADSPHKPESDGLTPEPTESGGQG